VRSRYARVLGTVTAVDRLADYKLEVAGSQDVATAELFSLVRRDYWVGGGHDEVDFGIETMVERSRVTEER
jgi:hypothetical protein